jgi:hypothetical protein
MKDIDEANSGLGGYGGALVVDQSLKLVLLYSKFQDNVASYGGAICMQKGSQLSASFGIFTKTGVSWEAGATTGGAGFPVDVGQVGTNKGGAIYAEAEVTMRFAFCAFSNSWVTGAAFGGGAISMGTDAILTLFFTTLTDHRAGSWTDGYIGQSTYISDSAKGGAIVLEGSGTVIAAFSTFTRNKVAAGITEGNHGGGAIWVGSGTTLTISNVRFKDNEAREPVTVSSGDDTSFHKVEGTNYGGGDHVRGGAPEEGSVIIKGRPGTHFCLAPSNRPDKSNSAARSTHG